ncbi:MAG TPA: FkbM family methyltransferase [Saprospiraceae bacterium]|nr:FkbM family methyltransferase [Saprospiraceae bacterium]
MFYFKNLWKRTPFRQKKKTNDGSDSVKFAKLLPNCTIHSFEPIPEIYQKLVKNTKPYKNIFPYNLAISDVNGEVMMNISEGASDASSSILEPMEHLTTNQEVLFSKKVNVKTLTFDAWMSQTNISHVDFMWLDMQGYELSALKHGIELLKGCIIIYTEVSQIEDYKNQGLYEELVIFLKSQNFIVYKEFFDYGKQGDVLFIKDHILT